MSVVLQYNVLFSTGAR